MGCGDEKLSKYLTQTFIAHCNAMICQQVTLSGDAEWPKVADAVIEAAVTAFPFRPGMLVRAVPYAGETGVPAPTTVPEADGSAVGYSWCLSRLGAGARVARGHSDHAPV